MADKSDLLEETKPLFDPLRFITVVMLVIAAVLFVESALGGAFLIGLSAAFSLIGLVILIAPSGKPNAIYLRAFRTDKATVKLRSELAAILGPEFRLSGIRPPRERTSAFLRFLAPGLFALRYAGSRFMELEAGDNWMARLWKTYQSSRLVLIDTRDMTPYVHQEIEMTVRSVGLARCIFIIDEEKSESEWRSTLATIVGQEGDASKFQLLDVTADRVNSAQLESNFNEILKQLPPGSSGELESGKQYVLDHVSEDLLTKSRHISIAAIFSAVVGLALSISSSKLAELLPGSVAAIFGIALFGFSMMVVGGGVHRAAVRAKLLKRFGHSKAAFRAWCVVILAVFLFFVGPVLGVAVAIGPLMKLRNAANEIAAIAALRTLTTSEVMYNTTYPTIGYACALPALGGDPAAGEATPQSAQFIDSILASGTKSGYKFAITDCKKEVDKGKGVVTGYNITAVPIKFGSTGVRGFCTNEEGVILVDPTGGTNCTEPLTAGSD